jgi:hypothetical protein
MPQELLYSVNGLTGFERASRRAVSKVVRSEPIGEPGSFAHSGNNAPGGEAVKLGE